MRRSIRFRTDSGGGDGGGDGHVGAQLVHGQPFDQVVRQRFGNVQQHVISVSLQKEVSDVFSLRCQQGGIDQPIGKPTDVIGDQPL